MKLSLVDVARSSSTGERRRAGRATRRAARRASRGRRPPARPAAARAAGQRTGRAVQRDRQPRGRDGRRGRWRAGWSGTVLTGPVAPVVGARPTGRRHRSRSALDLVPGLWSSPCRPCTLTPSAVEASWSGVVQYADLVGVGRVVGVVGGRSSPCRRHRRTPSGWPAPHRSTRPPGPAPSGEVMQSIHLYMQFGCSALAETIQVSDQPVEPSLGSTASTGDAPCRPGSVGDTCQVVPSTSAALDRRPDLP